MEEKNTEKIDGVEMYAKNIKNNGKILTDTYAKVVTENYEGTGRIEKKTKGKKSLENNWIKGVGGGIIATVVGGLILFYIFGIGKNETPDQYFPIHRFEYYPANDQFVIVNEASNNIWFEVGYIDGQSLSLGKNSGLLRSQVENTLYLLSIPAKEIFLTPTSTVKIQMRSSNQTKYCFEYMFSYPEVVKQSTFTGYKVIEYRNYAKGTCNNENGSIEKT